MAGRYLLDTNTASYILSGTYPAIARKLRFLPLPSVCVSTITEAELRFGVARKENPPALTTGVAEFLLRVEILPWDSAAAMAYAQLRAQLERAGTPLDAMDLLIAAHALACDATLVTNDRSFRQIRQLKLEDWTKR